MGAGSSSRRRGAPASTPEPEPEPEPKDAVRAGRAGALPPLPGVTEQTAGLSPAALAVATSSSWREDGSSPASFSSSATGPRQPSKGIGQYARRRVPASAVDVSRRHGTDRYAVNDVQGGVAAAVAIQSAFRAHRVRDQVRNYRHAAQGHSNKIATKRVGARRARRGRDRGAEKHSLRDSPLKPISPAGMDGKRTTLHPLSTNPADDPTLAVEVPEDAMRNARVREWVATGGEISPGGGITMTNRAAVADTFLSGSQAKPAKLSTMPATAAATALMGEKGTDQRASSVERVEGSHVGSTTDNNDLGGSASSYDAGMNSSPSRRQPSRPGPPSVATQSSWEDSASVQIPSPSDVRKRARARRKPRRRRHPPQRRDSASVVSRSDTGTSASAAQPPWQGPPAGWPGVPPGWGYAPPPSAGYGPPPATAPAGVAARHAPGGWADAFHQPPTQMAPGFPPTSGMMWPQQHPQQQSHYGQHPGGPPIWWGAPNDMQRFRADVAAAQAATRDVQAHAQQTGVDVSGDMLGRIDRIEGAMEALLQRLSDQPIPSDTKRSPLAEHGNSNNRQQN